MALGIATIARSQIGATSAASGDTLAAAASWTALSNAAGRQHRELVITAPPTNEQFCFMRLLLDIYVLPPEDPTNYQFEFQLQDLTNAVSLGESGTVTPPGVAGPPYWYQFALDTGWSNAPMAVEIQYRYPSASPDRSKWLFAGYEFQVSE